MSNYIGGTTSIIIDGKAANFKSDCTIYPQKEVREPIVDEGGFQGFTAKPATPRIKMRLTDDGRNFDWNSLLGAADKTIQVSSNNGRVYTLNKAKLIGEVEHTTKENEVMVEFAGKELVITGQ